MINPEDYPETPELDKMKMCKEHSQIIGEFLEWFKDESKYHIGERSEDDWHPSIESSISIEGLLAEYFGIDLKKASDEKDDCYKWMQNQLK